MRIMSTQLSFQLSGRLSIEKNVMNLWISKPTSGSTASDSAGVPLATSVPLGNS